MPNYSFDENAIRRAIDAARRSSQERAPAETVQTLNLADDGHLRLLAECITVEVRDGKVCIDLPLGLGSVCLPIPIPVPAGVSAQACLSICTTWGIPTGVRVTVSVLGNVVAEQTFGKC